LKYLTPYQKLQEKVVEELGELAGKKLLDAGCGTGNLIQTLAQENKMRQTKIWAVDFSEIMLKLAKQKSAGTSAQFLKADLNKNLCFDNAFFDEIVSINVLYALANPEKTMREFARVLRPDGLLVLVTPKNGYQNGLVLKEHCKSVKPDEYWLDMHKSPEKEKLLINEAIENKNLADKMIKVAEHNRAININAKFHFFEKSDLLPMIESAGFRILKTEPIYARQGILVVAQK
jgi:ubiquinone/menaquinone biosynthesis C-methylase UbiE